MPRLIIESEKAKQGRSGVRILMVLLGGLALAMLVWWGVETYGVAIAPDQPINSAPQDPAAQ